VKKILILLINISLVACSIIRPLYANEIRLPDIGASSSLALTPLMEEQIGREIAKQIRKSHQLIDDLELNEYIQSLGYSLVANSDDAYQNFHFFLISSNQINAFATPGGVIAVYSGLFINTQTESELASVLAHEIAHVTQRHLARSFEKLNQLSIPIMAGMIAGILLGAATGEGDVGAAAALGITAAGQQAQINYTRANEKEADRVGMRYLSLSGYDPSGMPGFFQKLERKNRYTDKNYPEFLRTHPVTINRIAEAAQLAEQYKEKYKKRRKPQNSLSYDLMKARLLVLTARNLNRLVQVFEARTRDKTVKDAPAWLYGYGLTLYKQEKYQQAINILEKLYQHDKNNSSYLIALAKSYIASNQKDDKRKGVNLFENAYQNRPYDLVITANYAFSLIQSSSEESIRKSIQMLEAYHKDNLKHPAIYKLLSIAYGKTNQLLKAHLSESEYYYLNGMLDSALEQLRIARKQNAGADFYTLSKIEARRQAIEEEKELYKLENL
jgi:predicted Zn-dependent protease